jgi:hypothetical protein
MANPDPLLRDLIAEIATWQPSILIDPTPSDRHPDHGALAVLTDFAMGQPALRTHRSTRLRYLVHGSLRDVPMRPLPALHLTRVEQDQKRQAILMHGSQLPLGGPKLLRFARPRERFLSVSQAAAPNAGQSVAMCNLNRGNLHLTIGNTRRVGIGPMMIQLAVLTETGSTIRANIPLPRRGKTGLVLPLLANASPTMAYVKLDRPSERRLGFFDSAGWRAVSVTRVHQMQEDAAAAREFPVEPRGVPVP